MHPSNPSPEPVLFTQPTPVPLNLGAPAPDEELTRAEEPEDPERWDGLS